MPAIKEDRRRVNNPKPGVPVPKVPYIPAAVGRSSAATYTPGSYKSGSYASQAASIIAAQLAEIRRVNNNGRNSADVAYNRNDAALLDQKGDAITELDAYAKKRAMIRAAVRGARGMTVGADVEVNLANIDSENSGRLTDIEKKYLLAAQNNVWGRDDMYDRMNEADMAAMSAAPGKQTELAMQMDDRAYGRWAQGEQLRASAFGANQDAIGAQYARDTATSQQLWERGMVDKGQAAQRLAEGRQMMAALTSSELDYTLPELAAAMRSAGYSDSETTQMYGSITPRSSAASRVAQLQRGGPAPTGYTGMSGWYMPRQADYWNRQVESYSHDPLGTILSGPITPAVNSYKSLFNTRY